MDNVAVLPPVPRRRLRDDVLEFLKVIARLVLVAAPTEIGRLVKGAVEYLWKRATVSVLHCREGFVTDQSLHVRRGKRTAKSWCSSASARTPC